MDNGERSIIAHVREGARIVEIEVIMKIFGEHFLKLKNKLRVQDYRGYCDLILKMLTVRIKSQDRPVTW